MELIKDTMIDAMNALIPFAEAPSSSMDDYLCHKGLTDMWNCERCSRAIHAYGAILSLEIAINELEEQ